MREVARPQGARLRRWHSAPPDSRGRRSHHEDPGDPRTRTGRGPGATPSVAAKVGQIRGDSVRQMRPQREREFFGPPQARFGGVAGREAFSSEETQTPEGRRGAPRLSRRTCAGPSPPVTALRFPFPRLRHPREMEDLTAFPRFPRLHRSVAKTGRAEGPRCADLTHVRVGSR